MFPVIDVRGSVIGFSGRILGDGEPKYMNSPETLVFSKSHNLFALNLAKKSKAGYILLAEGNVDVASLHQAGFDSAVASLGTSLTPEQARLLSRYTNEIVIAYDSDGAGQKASQRAITLLEKLDLRVRVLRMEGAKDPDEYLKKYGADAFRNLLEASENHIDYRLASIRQKYDLAVDEQKVAFLREACDMVAALPDKIKREVYAMRLNEMSGISVDAVKDQIEQIRKRKLRAAERQERRDQNRPILQQQKRTGVRYANPRSAAAEEGVVRLLYQDPELFRSVEPPDEKAFSSPELAHLYSLLREAAARGAPASLAAMSEQLSPEEMNLLTGIIQQSDDSTRRSRALADYIQTIRDEALRRDNTDLREAARRMKERKAYGDKV